MKTILRIEEAFLFGLAIYLFADLKYDWWWFPVLLFTPDIGMLGYLVNNNLGALIYNIVHHRAVSVSLYVAGAVMQVPWLQLIGVILFAHSSLDRVFEYGLKYGDDFKHTHLS
jgi:hypothetical protein